MTKFQHNDTVKCINNTNVPNLVVGMNYPVLTCDDNYLWLDSEGGLHPYCFSPDRFELTDEEVTYISPRRLTFYYEEEIEEDYTSAFSLLRKAASALEDCHSYKLAEEINKFLGEE